MAAGFPRLLGDIGGTNARWAWQGSAHGAVEHIAVVPCGESVSLVDSARAYLQARNLPTPHSAGIGIATAVTGDVVRMTNHSWSFSIKELTAQLGLQRCLVINDFTALALSLPALEAGDLRAIGGGQAVPQAPLALLGPGTGLGVSGVVRAADGRAMALSGEGGHATLAAADDHEAAVLACLRQRFGHVSAERVLSGPGLVNLYEAVVQVAGVQASTLTPADVTAAAMARADVHAVNAVRLFASFLGNMAGNLALTLGARGGVYVGGGIVPRLGDRFDAALFRRRFEEKGRFAEYLSQVPTWVITAATPALVGVAQALDEAPAHGAN
jgi:glucokinase